MRKIRLLALHLIIFTSISSFATDGTFSCGELKYKGRPVPGGLSYFIKKVGQQISLYMKPIVGNSTPEWQDMRAEPSSPRYRKFSAQNQDLEASFVYDETSNQVNTFLSRSGNRDWSTRCSILPVKSAHSPSY